MAYSSFPMKSSNGQLPKKQAIGHAIVHKSEKIRDG